MQVTESIIQLQLMAAGETQPLWKDASTRLGCAFLRNATLVRAEVEAISGPHSRSFDSQFLANL